MMKKVLILCFFLPSSALAGSFFEEGAVEQRRGWDLFDPQEFVESVFGGEVPVQQEYRIEINVPERRLYLYKGDQRIRSHAVAVGSYRYRTPVGPRFIENITWNPWWYPPPSDWAKNEKPHPPGPGNPLGRVKMSLGGDILLHGTNAESSVGRPVSHGCMRMKNREAEELAWFFQRNFSDETEESLLGRYKKNPWQSFYVRLNQMIPVTIVYDRVAIRDKELQIYPDIYGRQKDVEEEILSELSTVGIPLWVVDLFKIDEIKRETGIVKVPISELLVFTSSGL